jgi:hypothetical protein
MPQNEPGLYRLRKNSFMAQNFKVLYQGMTLVVPQDAENKGWALAPAKLRAASKSNSALFPQPL